MSSVKARLSFRSRIATASTSTVLPPAMNRRPCDWALRRAGAPDARPGPEAGGGRERGSWGPLEAAGFSLAQKNHGGLPGGGDLLRAGWGGGQNAQKCV